MTAVRIVRGGPTSTPSCKGLRARKKPETPSTGRLETGPTDAQAGSTANASQGVQPWPQGC